MFYPNKMKRYLISMFLYVALITIFLIIRQSFFIKAKTKEPTQTTTPEHVIPTSKNRTKHAVPENIPEIYLEENVPPKYFNKTCAKFPKVFKLKFSVDPWQIQEISNGLTIQLFNAYVDDRGADPVVRIIAMINEKNYEKSCYCYLWYRYDRSPAVVKGQPLLLWVKSWTVNIADPYHPYLITCPFPSFAIPRSVSVVEKNCDQPSNNLKIHYEKNTQKKNFVVCVKGLNYPFNDISLRLIEWIELISLLGAEKIQFYNYHVHPQTLKVLNYYRDKNLIGVVPLTLVGGPSTHPYLQNQYLRNMNFERRLQEIIPYNDCLYRHLSEFKFVVSLDVDEVIVPMSGTWIDLITHFEENRSSYMTVNVYFLDSYLHNHTWFEDVPKYMHMLQHVYRSEEYSKQGWYSKGFHNVSRILGLHNHFPFKCLDECNFIYLKPEVARLQHYRTDCKSDCGKPTSTGVKDPRVWNFKDQLIERVKETIETLKLL